MVLTRQCCKELGISPTEPVTTPPKKKQAKISTYFQPKANEANNPGNLHSHEWSIDHTWIGREEKTNVGGEGVDLATELKQAELAKEGPEASLEQELFLENPEAMLNEPPLSSLIRREFKVPFPD